ncbi:hypothetical protein [Methanosarcina horonobensis]|uniref:hypothetical protein n=1 Tax=Methanosarcina horonobensis TaxID=418008 RepID=UPI0022B86519|nr:hypothetical protein [Methanosarcina horonobensis]
MLLEIQQVAERILKAHGVIKETEDLLKGEWFLKLQKPEFEKKLVLAKSGEEVFIGLYVYPEETPVPDPNFVLLSQYGFWYPQRIEEKFEETVASFFLQELMAIMNFLMLSLKTLKSSRPCNVIFRRHLKIRDGMGRM